jgi:hypothetical protein
MGAPQTIAARQFGYTLPTVAAAICAGTWIWAEPNQSRLVQAFASFDAGNGPSGSDFVARVLSNSVNVLQWHVTDGQDSEITSFGAPARFIFNGDLIQFEVVATGGSTGPVEMGFVYY